MKYDSYEGLFEKSTNPDTFTSVKEIKENANVPYEKIVIGKSAKIGTNGYVKME